LRIPITQRDPRSGICGYHDEATPQYVLTWQHWHHHHGGLSHYTVLSRLTGRIILNLFVDWFPNAPLNARVKRRSVA
jgi:hypothetical protein